MKKYIYILAILVSTLTSCINWGLEELPLYDEVEITSFDLEHRYTTENANGVESVVFTKLNSSVDISSENAIITVTATIPPPTQIFTQEIRRSISLENIAGYFKLSPASKVEPLDGAPELGVPGDFSVERKYKVTAADGKTTKIWTVKVNPLPEINQFEGLYKESGTLVRIGEPADQLDAEIYLETINSNTCRAQAGKSVFNNPDILYQIQVNADNTVTIKNDPNSVVEIFPQDGKVSTYNPTTKTFDLHYHYRNGDRLFDTKLILK